MIDKFFYTPLAEYRPKLQPNGRIVRCVYDYGNGYLKIQVDDVETPNTWITNITYLREVIKK